MDTSIVHPLGFPPPLDKSHLSVLDYCLEAFLLAFGVEIVEVVAEALVLALG